MKKIIALLAALSATPLLADPAQINNVAVSSAGDSFTFNVTIQHGDTGWDDYVDAWRVKDMDGTVLGTRELAHPHVDEQPFTRSLSGVRIPDGVDTVVIEAHVSVGGWGPDVKQVKIR